MSGTSAGNGVPQPLDIRIPEFAYSWAGPGVARGTLFFGSEDGLLLMTDENGAAKQGPRKGIAPDSDEAINGVAGIGLCIAVSTRADITFWTNERGIARPCLVAPVGSHGVAVTANGYFIAPLGRTGLLVEKPDFRGAGQLMVLQTDRDLCFYAATSCGSLGGNEVLVCAMRSGGLSTTQFQGHQDQHVFTTMAFDEVEDLVDVCPIGPSSDSRAVAAVARNGALLLFRDVLNDRPPVNVKFETIKGTAYRVLSCRGHLFVLTSKGLYVLAHLADRFLAGQGEGTVTAAILVMPMEAVDANLCWDRWLLAVLPDVVRRYDVAQIHSPDPQSVISKGWTAEQRPQQFYPSVNKTHPKLVAAHA